KPAIGNRRASIEDAVVPLESVVRQLLEIIAINDEQPVKAREGEDLIAGGDGGNILTPGIVKSFLACLFAVGGGKRYQPAVDPTEVVAGKNGRAGAAAGIFAPQDVGFVD